jgi:hypothetical protein
MPRRSARTARTVACHAGKGPERTDDGGHGPVHGVDHLVARDHGFEATVRELPAELGQESLGRCSVLDIDGEHPVRQVPLVIGDEGGGHENCAVVGGLGLSADLLDPLVDAGDPKVDRREVLRD